MPKPLEHVVHENRKPTMEKYTFPQIDITDLASLIKSLGSPEAVHELAVTALNGRVSSLVSNRKAAGKTPAQIQGECDTFTGIAQRRRKSDAEKFKDMFDKLSPEDREAARAMLAKKAA